MPDLEHTFEKQIQHLSIRIEKLQRVNKQYSYLRLIHVLLGIPLIWASFQFAGNWAGRIVTVAVVAAFFIVLYRHGRLKDSINRHRILLDLKSTQIARIRLDWDRMPRVSGMPMENEHPFGIDLDIGHHGRALSASPDRHDGLQRGQQEGLELVDGNRAGFGPHHQKTEAGKRVEPPGTFQG